MKRYIIGYKIKHSGYTIRCTLDDYETKCNISVKCQEFTRGVTVVSPGLGAHYIAQVLFDVLCERGFDEESVIKELLDIKNVLRKHKANFLIEEIRNG